MPISHVQRTFSFVPNSPRLLERAEARRFMYRDGLPVWIYGSGSRPMPGDDAQPVNQQPGLIITPAALTAYLQQNPGIVIPRDTVRLDEYIAFLARQRFPNQVWYYYTFTESTWGEKPWMGPGPLPTNCVEQHRMHLGDGTMGGWFFIRWIQPTPVVQTPVPRPRRRRVHR